MYIKGILYILTNTDDFANRSVCSFPFSVCSATFSCSVCPTEQIDEGLAGKQRQYEGWIHNLSKELNHYKAANLELNTRLKEVCSSVNQQPRDPAKGNINLDVFMF